MANVLILGGGFGGLLTAEKLSKTVGKEHQVTLVSPNVRFVFYPALVRLAFGDCEPDDITFDLVERLRELNTRFVQGEVVKINTSLKRVQVAGNDFNGDISYDYLVIALGRRLATEKVRGFYEYARHLLDVSSALEFGEAIRDFRKGKIIVGMSPQSFLPAPVCETAFALSYKFKQEIENNEVSLVIVFPETINAAFGGADLQNELIKALENHKIVIATEFPVKEITKNQLLSANGLAINYDLLMFLPPFRGQSFLSDVGISNDLGFIKTDELMRVQGFSGIYAVGDIVDLPGPKLAQMAVRQAEVAALNIISEIKGKELKDYYYHEIATIIDEGGADSIYLHYGVWDESLYRLKKGKFWGLVKKIHDKLWRAAHEN